MGQKTFLDARERIREIDAEMARLFCRRMQAVEEIAAYKKQQGMPVLDAQRERELIERNTALIEDAMLCPYYLRFLQNTMQLSREYQHAILEDAAADEAVKGFDDRELP